MKAIRLKIEHLFDPVGVDFSAPRLFWNCEGGRKQTAYQIVAADDSGSVLWDSGRVEGAVMCVKWGGAPVPPKTKVLWKVQLWDEKDAVGDWSEASFETGINAWSAKWITGDYQVNKKERYPVDCFRKAFRAADAKRHGCISPPAVCMRQASTGGAWAISFAPLALQTTASGCSIRPTM